MNTGKRKGANLNKKLTLILIYVSYQIIIIII